MAGKVAAINQILTKDNLADQLCQLYSNWASQRSQKESEWRELRNYLFATDTTKTSNSRLPWKNKTTLPKLTQIRDNLHANYMDALFPNDNWLRWEGYSQDAVIRQKREAIEGYMKNKIRESGFRKEVSKLVYDYIDYGNAFAEVVWIDDKHIDPVSGEEVQTYIGPGINRVSPFDLVFNPTATSFRHSPKFTRYVKSIGELIKEIKHNPGLQYNEKILKEVIDERKALTNFKMEDINKAEGYTIDGFGSLHEYYQSGYVELLEFEGDVYDGEELYENQIVTIIDRRKILRRIPNPSWLGRDTKHHVGWRDRTDNLYSMGPLDNLVGMQYRIDHLENIKADALDLTIHPPIKIVGDVEPFTWGPGEEIHIDSEGDVALLSPNPAALQVNNEIGSILGLMEELAGAPKEAMGIRSAGEKTAFEVQQLQNAAGRIFQNKINKFEIDFLEPVLNMMLEMARRMMPTADIVRVMDTDIGVMDFISISKEDITAKGKLRPIGARHYAARAQLVQNILGIFNSPIGQMIAPHVSGKKLAKMVEDYMGFAEFDFIQDNVAIFEQAETQTLINEVQQQMRAESGVPVEETLMSGAIPAEGA